MLSILADFPAHLVAMALLLAASAFFSGAETALFNLSREQLRRFRESRNPLRHLAAHLMDDPRRLLVTLLFGNNLTNTALFVTSVVLMHSIREAHPEHAAQWQWILAVGTPLVLIIFGEVTPKSIGAVLPEQLAPLASVPLRLLEYLFLPVRLVLVNGIVMPLERLIVGPRRPEATLLSTEELQAIVEVAAREGAVSSDESDMLIDVLELGELKVRDVMMPRVEVVGCDLITPSRLAQVVFRRTRNTKMIVYEGVMDNVVGLVYAKTVFLNPDKPLADIVLPVYIVPETKTVESLLKDFRARKIQFAAVVDEYGGFAGIITLEDCIEQIVGSIEDDTDQPASPVQRVSDTEYVMAGNLSIRSWADVFDMDIPEDARYTTVAGFVTSLLGRMPRAGDVAKWRNLVFTVEEVRYRRVMRVRLRLLALAEDVQGNGI